MYKRYRILLLGLLLLSIALGCNTIAQVQPTAPSEPTKTPIPGWEKFEGGNVELWLPESYEGGNLEEDIDVVVEKLKSLGPDFEQMAEMIEQNSTAFVIWAFDSEIGDSGGLTSVAVTTEKVLSVMTIDTYLDSAIKQLPATFQVVERDIVSIEGYPAGRLVFGFSVSGVAVKEVLYTVKDGNTMWVITCGTTAEEYDQRLPVFEQSVLTFAIHH
ncbi:MAG: hypothetical protein EHM70_12765 [Chloroflexota bacterium]|nr:MAG: hypothetical protein EHM70_12765 [Chloroflexota bacterium]